jgi:two-component system, chemotaxis family, sensor kinase CheA
VLDSTEVYQLFLALVPARIAAARAALSADAQARATELAAALVPLAVDSALLGADGVSALARAVARNPAAPEDQLERALTALEQAAEKLGHGDASGARVDESELLAWAEALGAGARRGAPLVEREAPALEPEAALPAGELAESRWEPQLADDMIAAFLDECVERTEALAGRLLALEQRAEPELINEIFRDLHTLKGSSAFAGLKKLNRVAHLAEDLIGELRDGRRVADRALVDVMLETLDVLRAIVERARAREPIDIDVRGLLARLKDPSALAAAGPAVAPRLEDAAAPASAAPARTAAVSQATLRIDFEKVDLLLNLVGEVVLARGKLTATAEAQGALLREVAQLRKKLGVLLGEPAAKNGGKPASKLSPSQLVDELQRTERVLRETYGELDSTLGGLRLAVGQLRDNVMKLRMVPIARLFTKYQRTVRELSHKLGKQVKVELVGEETELDKVLVESLEDPILHLVRNAVDHGIETPERRAAAGKVPVGTVRLSAEHRGGQIAVTIEDDGAGMDAATLRRKAVQKSLISPEEAELLSESESLQLIFLPGFSTTATVSDVSGRGVGMDVVKDAISRLKGSIHLASTPAQGSTIELRLPLTLAITQVLTARVGGGELVAVPLDAVVSAQAVEGKDMEVVADGTCLRVGGELVPIVPLAQVLGLDSETTLGEGQEAAVVVVELGNDRLGLLVEQVLGRHEVVIKSLGPLLAAAPCAAGATLIGDRVLLVLDLADVAERARHPRAADQAVRPKARPSRRARVLVAEDSPIVREGLRRELSAAGFEVVTAVDGSEALELARSQTFDAVSTDVMMPKMDGYDLARALRKDPRYQATPIVMVTSKDARIDTLRGHDAGADAYLTKPTDPRRLVATLDALLRRRDKAGSP